MADDFESGPRSAASGGTTTAIPFNCQMKGESLRAEVTDYHRRAEGKSVIDYAFHLIVTDPTEQVSGQELPALIRDGYTSFKVYMTYDDLKLDDRQILEVLAVARREGKWLTGRLEHAAHTSPLSRMRGTIEMGLGTSQITRHMGRHTQSLADR